MSGFVVLLAPRAIIDSPLIEELVDALAFRGPDGRCSRRFDTLAMAHALLATREKGMVAGGRETVGPHSLDGRSWLVADARLDDRRRLAAALDQPGLVEAEDAELLLQAWHRWGADCVEHLVGDFAFALWDAPRNRLFAARDPLGIKPCYWTHRGPLLAVANTLRSLRQLPETSDALRDEVVADFLLWGSNQDPATTVFRDIQRLPPGHRLLAVAGKVPRIEAYWQWPDGEIVEEGDEERLTRYRTLLDEAVADRLTNSRATIFLSGGMDSTTVAALARDTLVARGLETTGLRTLTAVYQRLFDDPEGPVARYVAAALGLAHHQRPVDNDRLFAGWEERFAPGDLYDGSMLPLLGDFYRRAAARGRIALTGDGSDPALLHPADQLWRLLARGRLDQALAYLVGHTWRRRHLPPLGLRTLLARRRDPPSPRWPSWLAPDFVRRSKLDERYRAHIEASRQRFADRPRPEAFRALADPQWVSHFESLDPGATGLAVETRYPFFDRRLIELALATPAAWCLDKRLLRQAMAGRLPAEILDRPKTPMAGRPFHQLATPPAAVLSAARVENPTILEYVELAKLNEALDRQPVASPGVGGRGGEAPRVVGTRREVSRGLESRAYEPYDPRALRAFSLAYWLTEAGIGP